ncbi:MAG: toprim domain-containing protein [Ruminococcus sp.]
MGQKPDYDVWKKQNRLSLSGTSDVALQSYLQRYPEIKNIVLCLDNDEAGRNGIAKINEKYADRYNITVHVPKLGKDYNETLVSYLTVAESYRTGEQLITVKKLLLQIQLSQVTLIQKIRSDFL